MGTEQASVSNEERMGVAKNDHETTVASVVNPVAVPDISGDTGAVGAVSFKANRDSGGRVEQVRTAARDAIDDKVKPRVDKIRKASSVVLDEAAYPGVRFFLVVGVLFVVFLVLLFLSKWIT